MNGLVRACILRETSKNSSGTKEQLLKSKSLKRVTAEVLQRSAQDIVVGQSQDTGHEGA
jgi:hypothetical protein